MNDENPDQLPVAEIPAARADGNTGGAELTAGQLWDEQNKAANAQLDELAANATQRDWLLITQKLDRTRQQIGSDYGLTLLATAFLKLKRDHGGANWDKLLDMTDKQLEELHGFPAGDRPDESPQAGD